MEGSEILEPDSQKSTTNGYLSYNYEYDFGTEEEDEWDEETEYYDEKTKRKYYFSFQRRTAGVNLFGLQINNFAYVSNKIAKICSLWEEKSIKIAEIKLFFKPQHTSIGRKPYHSPAELLSSDIIMQVPTNVIQGKCEVDSLSSFMKKKSYSELNYYISENEFCRYTNKFQLEKLEDIKTKNVEVTQLTKDIKLKLEKNTENQNKYLKNSKKLKQIRSPTYAVIEIEDEENIDQKINNFKNCTGIKGKIQLVSDERNSEKLEDTIGKLYLKTVEQLRKECRSLSLPSGGVKEDLIARISAFYKNGQSSPYFSKKKKEAKTALKEVSERMSPLKEKGKKVKKEEKFEMSSSSEEEVKPKKTLKRLRRESNKKESPPPKEETKNYKSAKKLNFSDEEEEKDTKSKPRKKTKAEIEEKITEQQRQRRTESSACLAEEIDEDGDDDLSDFIVPDEFNPKSSYRPKKVSKKENPEGDIPKPNFRRLKKGGNGPEKLNDFYIDPSIKPYSGKQAEESPSSSGTRKSARLRKNSQKPDLVQTYFGNKKPEGSTGDQKEEDDEDDSSFSEPDDLSDFIVPDNEFISDIHPDGKKKKKTSEGSTVHSGDEENEGTGGEWNEIDQAEEGGEVVYFQDSESIYQPIMHLTLHKAFFIYIQYLISILLDPKFLKMLESHTESLHYFEPARKKIESACSDRKHLVITSSIWDPSLKNVLIHFPVFQSWKTSNITSDCQACNRSNHPATYSAHVSGTPYKSDVFWSRTRLENVKFKDPKVNYELGSHCHHRTWLFHQLQHYKYQLYKKLEVKVASFTELQAAGDNVGIIDSIINDEQYVDKLYTSYKQLLTEVDEFGLNTNKSP